LSELGAEVLTRGPSRPDHPVTSAARRQRRIDHQGPALRPSNRHPHVRVYRSADGGASWSDASGTGLDALPNVPASSIVVEQHDGETAYVGTDIGVFRTRDGGASWEAFDDGMPRTLVTGLALRALQQLALCQHDGTRRIPARALTAPPH